MAFYFAARTAEAKEVGRLQGSGDLLLRSRFSLEGLQDALASTRLLGIYLLGIKPLSLEKKSIRLLPDGFVLLSTGGNRWVHFRERRRT